MEKISNRFLVRFNHFLGMGAMLRLQLKRRSLGAKGVGKAPANCGIATADTDTSIGLRMQSHESALLSLLTGMMIAALGKQGVPD